MAAVLGGGEDSGHGVMRRLRQAGDSLAPALVPLVRLDRVALLGLAVAIVEDRVQHLVVSEVDAVVAGVGRSLGPDLIHVVDDGVGVEDGGVGEAVALGGLDGGGGVLVAHPERGVVDIHGVVAAVLEVGVGAGRAHHGLLVADVGEHESLPAVRSGLPVAVGPVGLRRRAVVVVGVHAVGESELLEVAGAGDLSCLLAGLRERRQQHGGKDGNDGDDDKQLDEREGLPRCLAQVSVHDFCWLLCLMVLMDGEAQNPLA